jgi:hypothetical protein
VAALLFICLPKEKFWNFFFFFFFGIHEIVAFVEILLGLALCSGAWVWYPLVYLT